MTTHEPNPYDVRAEIRQHIELYSDGRLGGDQPPGRVAWVIACFRAALIELDKENGKNNAQGAAAPSAG